MSKIDKNLFILPGKIIDQEDNEDLKQIVSLNKDQIHDRWNTTLGKHIISTWKASEFKREVLESLVGKYYGQIDIRGITLDECTIKKQDLSYIDFFSSSLKKTKFIDVNLTGTWLSESNIQGTKFEWSKMDNILLDNVDYNIDTEFKGVDLNKINFTLATLVQELAKSQQRIDHLKERHPVIAKILWATSDFGRSLTRWMLWVAGVLLFFALLYWKCPNATSGEGLFDSLYFSFVTFTTLGYGDILPISIFSKICVVIEVVLGYLMGGLLVAILAKKVIGD